MREQETSRELLARKGGKSLDMQLSLQQSAVAGWPLACPPNRRRRWSSAQHRHSGCLLARLHSIGAQRCSWWAVNAGEFWSATGLGLTELYSGTLNLNCFALELGGSVWILEIGIHEGTPHTRIERLFGF